MSEHRDGSRTAGSYVRLRPASSTFSGLLALAAASRVGGWTPPLPPKVSRPADAGKPDSAVNRDPQASACK